MNVKRATIASTISLLQQSPWQSNNDPLSFPDGAINACVHAHSRAISLLVDFLGHRAF